MRTIISIAAGVDVHKEKLSIAVVKGDDPNKLEIVKWESKTFTEDLADAGRKLLSLGVTEVAMESTGIYWRPVYKVWSSLGLIITLGNAYHMKNVPGRKTDEKDSEWIAQLHRSGLIRSSYIPDEEFQELRSLTRHRDNIVNDQARIKNRIQKILEDGNIKLTSVISDVFGVAGRKVLTGIIEGKDDPDELVALVKTNVKAKKEAIRKSLVHTLGSYHRLILKQLYSQYLYNEQLIFELDREIYDKTKKHEKLIKKLDAIPGIDRRSAEKILAEATTNMENFKDAKSFAAWCGVAPGNNESAGKKKESM